MQHTQCMRYPAHTHRCAQLYRIIIFFLFSLFRFIYDSRFIGVCVGSSKDSRLIHTHTKHAFWTWTVIFTGNHQWPHPPSCECATTTTITTTSPTIASSSGRCNNTAIWKRKNRMAHDFCEALLGTICDTRSTPMLNVPRVPNPQFTSATASTTHDIIMIHGWFVETLAPTLQHHHHHHNHIFFYNTK